MLVKNKTLAVTGAGSGIGREITLLLLAKGARIAAIDLNEDSLHETKQLAGEFSQKLSIHAINISDKAAIESLPEQLITIHGQVDGIINNAGIIQPFVRINDLDYHAIERVMNVNFFGSLFMIKTFLPYLLKRQEAHIVNISSMGGFLPVPGQSIYGASKAAIKLLSEGLYSELLNTGVRVSIVFPGAVGTNITANSGVKLPVSTENSGENSKIKMLTAPKAAEIIIKGIEQNRVRIYVGQDSKIMNLLYRLSPNFATNFIGKKMKALLPD
jgi:short-subunit dehydrogenase